MRVDLYLRSVDAYPAFLTLGFHFRTHGTIQLGTDDL
jgi:hypothetical protein